VTHPTAQRRGIQPSRLLLRFFLLLLALTSTLAGCDTPALPPEPVEIPVPPDESLTTDEYIGLGLPDPDKEWTGEDLAKAQSVLAEVADKGARHLPRYESEKSGAVFARLISTDSLKTFVDPASPLGGRLVGVATYSEAFGKLLQIYFNALQAQQVDGREMLELSETSYRVMNAMMQVFEQTVSSAEPDNPALPAFTASLDQLRAAMGAAAVSAPLLVKEGKLYRPADLEGYLAALEEILPEMVRGANPASRPQISDTIQVLENDPTLVEYKPGLEKLRAKVQAAAEEAAMAHVKQQIKAAHGDKPAGNDKTDSDDKAGDDKADGDKPASDERPADSTAPTQQPSP
jgi:hypothetical protein